MASSVRWGRETSLTSISITTSRRWRNEGASEACGSLGLDRLLAERALHGVELVVLLLDLPLQRLDLRLVLAQLALSFQLLVEEGCAALLPCDRLGQFQRRQAQPSTS